MEFSGKAESVQVINHMSQPYGGLSCEYENIFARDGRVLGSIENYGKQNRFEYFDYDRTGTFQVLRPLEDR